MKKATAWVEGEVERGWFGNVKARGQAPLQIETWRCDKCGYLENYAPAHEDPSMSRMTVNGRPVQFDIDPETPLLWALRDAANLTGTKYGCGEGDCGACMVIVDGEALRSCLITTAEAEGRYITTIEGLAATARTRCSRRWWPNRRSSAASARRGS